ncbi:MAG: glycosyltransferase [Dehalococcoidales bacterium]|nr:glycosyltransferase [Dehalococcoidales bacterium]
MNSTNILADGTVYSKRKSFCPFSTHSLETYKSIAGDGKIEKLQGISQRLKGLKILELNSTAQGGGVAEMLYSSVPFLNMLGIEAEWKIIQGHRSYFECTKKLHNLLQGMKGAFTPEMKRIYRSQLEECVSNNIIDYSPNVVNVNDPQPMLLCRYLKKATEHWFWRCHIDVEPAIRSKNGLLSLINDWIVGYDAAIFSAARYVFPPWPVPKFIIPPFIDPFSEKNRELTKEEIDRVLAKYEIDQAVPIIAQISRFDPWKGLDRTIATFRQVRKERKCQLVIAGGSATDDPESEMILDDIYSKTRGDEDIHVLNLSLDNRLENYTEVNALQRAASVIMQPSTREGFGLVITEALWKGKPVIASNVGGIPFQIKKGNTGYFYQNPKITAQKIIYLLDNPQVAERIGKRGRRYVQEHFLIVDRITDYLMSIIITMNSTPAREKLTESVTSFYPW